MRKTALSILSVVLLLGANATVLNDAQAFNMGNMMNPSRWFDDDDRYDRGYYRGYGPYGGYGGYGPYGYGGGPYGWGGYPGYGGWGGGYPGYGGWGGGQGPSTIVVNPSPDSSRQQAPPAPRLPE